MNVDENNNKMTACEATAEQKAAQRWISFEEMDIWYKR